MSAKTDQKTAATSTPAAAPAGSLPQERPPAKPAAPAAADRAEQGADAEIGQEDILRALGQLSDAQQVNDDDATASAAPAAAAPAAEAGDDDEAGETEAAEAPSAESDEDAAASGDAAAPESGDVAETDPEAEAPATEAEPAKGAKGEGFQKRIDELTSRAKSAEEDLARERERAAALLAERSSLADPGVLDYVDTPEQLAQERQRLVALQQKLLRNPNGVELPDPQEKGKMVQYDAEAVADLSAQVFALLHEAIPTRADWLRDKGRFDAEAVNAYPWLKDSRSGPGAQVSALIQQQPALRRLGPNHRLIAADSLVGQTLREAGIPVTPELISRLKREASAGRPAAAAASPAAKPAKPAPAPVRRTPPPAPRGAGVVPARQGQRAAQGSVADKRLKSGDGNVNDLAASIAANL